VVVIALASVLVAVAGFRSLDLVAVDTEYLERQQSRERSAWKTELEQEYKEQEEEEDENKTKKREGIGTERLVSREESSGRGGGPVQHRPVQHRPMQHRRILVDPRIPPQQLSGFHGQALQSPGSKDEWHYLAYSAVGVANEGAQYGPIPLGQLMQLYRKGVVGQTTLCWAPCLPEWIAFGSMLGIAYVRTVAPTARI
jgi:hypothetical protein